MDEYVLVVEDDQLLSKAIVEELEEEGFAVVWAKNGEEALDKVKDYPVAMAYLDVMMPGNIDGFEVLRRLKEPGSKYAKIPVVMLTNLGQMKDIDRAMEMGASDYVVKSSLDLSKLVELTKKKLEVYRAQA